MEQITYRGNMLRKTLEILADAIELLANIMTINLLGWLLPKEPDALRKDLQNLINKYIS